MGKLDLAVIDNSSFSALIDDQARINWACLPRFDGDPVFCSLLNSKNNGEAGFYDLHLVDYERSEQRYRPNTAIVETVLYDAHGGSVEVVDFAPRFKQFGRVFEPLMTIRRVRPLSGSPKIQVRLRPQYDYGATEPTVEHGSNHIRYIGNERSLRLTTNAPISFVKQEIPFPIDRPKDFILNPDESMADSIEDLTREFLEKTEQYWREWCRYLALPFVWQDAVIRAAITLKMSNFEDTEEPDASLLMMPQLGFINPKSEQFLGTLAFIEKKLRRGNYLFRYAAADDFGLPETSFNVCTFWYIDALAAVGRKAEARELFEFMLDKRNSVGLLSEDIDPRTGELWGNFPQTYSMVGLINSAKNLSKSWKELF